MKLLIDNIIIMLGENKKIYFHLIFALFFIGSEVASCKEIFVSNDGSDSNIGSIDEPFETIEKARDVAKHLIKSVIKEDIVIYLRGGVYRFSRSFVLNKDDSGVTKQNIIYSGYKNEKVILTGGVSIRNKPQRISNKDVLSKLDKNAIKSVYQVNLTDISADIEKKFDWVRTGVKTNFKSRLSTNELYSGGEPMIFARWPNTEWARTGKIINIGSVYSKDKKGNTGGVFRFFDKRISRWVNEPDLWLHGFWKKEWYDEAIPLKKIDFNRKYIELVSAHYYGIGEKKRFYVFNALSELDMPGEYYIDRKKMILYLWPIRGINNSNLVISVLKSPLVVFSNASNIVFKNLIISEGRSSGILIKGGRNIKLDNIVIKNMGGEGVIIRGGKNHIVSNSNFTNLGTKGIIVSGGNRERLISANHLIVKNKLSHFGRRIYTKSWGIELKGVGNVVLKNSIHYSPHTAIRVYGNNHKIIGNDIFSVCNETSDAGAIYLGRDWTERGNIIERNYIHDSSSLNGKGDVIGIYLDDLASGSIIKNNIISNIHRGILVGGGRDNLIYNNLINQSKIPVSIDSRGLHWASSWTKTSGILQKRLQAMPISSKLWKKAYPQLVKINENSPALPKNNVIVNNVFFNSGSIKSDPVTWLYSKIENNHEFKRNVEIFKNHEYIGINDNFNKMIKSKIIGWEAIRINQ